jgi:DNA-binding transcriptional LysR family regulator
MDIKRMRHAIALADELNFARAAEKVHLSQPALSRSIQTLEQELGLQLFDRDNRNVALTTVGASFMAQARRLVYQMRSLERDMGLLRSSEIGQVAFGVGPLPTAAFLPALLSSVQAERPGLQLTVSSHNWRYLLQHLHAEEIEFFVADTRDIEPDAAIAITPLCRQYGSFLCRTGHPLLAQAERQPADLLRYGFVSLKLPAGLQAALRRLLGLEPNAPLPVVVECDNVQVLADLACESDVVLLASEAAVAHSVAAGRLAPLRFGDAPPLYAEIGIVQLYGRSLSPGAALVLERLRAIAATAPGTAMHGGGEYPATPGAALK